MKTFKRIAVVLISLFLFITCSKDSSEENLEQQIKYELNVSISPEDGGTVTPNQGSYNKGQKVTITASPASGYFLKSWSGAASGSENTVTITMDSNKSINVIFEEIINSATFIITDEQWNENLISIDTTDFTLQFKKEILTLYNFKAGDIIVSTTDGGLLRRIQDISENTDELIVKTGFATIAEAFEDLDEQNSFTLIPDTESKDYWLSEGVTTSSKIAGDFFPLIIEETLKDPDNSAASIDITGSYDVEVSVDGSIVVKKPKLEEFDLTYEINQSLNLTAVFASNGVFEKQRKIANIPCGDYPIGPVIVTPTIELYVGVNANIEGSLELGMTESLINEINLNYDGEQWSHNNTSLEEITFSPVDFKIAADAKVYIKPQLTFKIYRFVGPYVNVELYGRAESSITDDLLDYKACLGADIDLGVKMEVMQAELFDFAVDIYEYEVCPIEDQITFFDEDKDGVSDELDQCPQTPLNTNVDENGCSENDLKPKTFIPDINFEKRLIDLGLDDNIDQYVITENIINLESFSYYGDWNESEKIEDLTGIQDFINLKSLNVRYNQITQLDLSKNTKLESIYCFNNNLNSIDFSNSINLEELYISNNNLSSSLDLSIFPALREVDIAFNNYTNLEIGTKQAEYLKLNVFSNQLSTLDVSGVDNLLAFTSQENNLSCIKVNQNQIDDTFRLTKLWEKDPIAYYSLNCDNADKIFVADRNFEQALIELGYDDVVDNSLLVARIEAVKTLNVNNKQISDLTGIEGFKELEVLSCEDNLLSNINISNNFNLIELWCSGNQLEFLDISKNNSIKNVRAYENRLSQIIVGNSNSLEELYLAGNLFESINFSGAPNLKKLYLNSNSINDIYVGNNLNLTNLQIEQNQVQNIDLSNNINLFSFNARSNQLNFLDISAQINLVNLDIRFNDFGCVRVNQNQLNNYLDSPYWNYDSTVQFSLNCSDPNNGGGNLDPNGLTPEINDLVPQWILDEMVNLGMEINTGDSPPILENTYLASPMTLIGTNLSNDSPIGSQFADYLLTVFNQNNSSLTIDVEYINGPESGTGYGSFIVGNNGDFSIFTEVNSINGNNEPARLIHVFSGRKENTGLSNFKIAVFMLDNNGNPSGTWIPNGTGRVFEDSDGFSEISTTSRRKINNSLKSLSEN